LASFLDAEKFDVTIYERNKALGRKFLVAGKGGFNLTHSEPLESLIEKYAPNDFLDATLRSFDNTQFRSWLDDIGISTYIGSSRRVFPVKGIKPIEVLRRIKDHIESCDHKIVYDMLWTGWSEDGLLFENGEIVYADYVVFCLGGGSWKITGSDGQWLDAFQKKGVNISPFITANCAYEVDWDDHFLKKSEGKPLKNIAITSQDSRSVGEAIITKFGIEGSAVYALTDAVQSQFETNGQATIFIDLKPMLSQEEIVKRLKESKRKLTDILMKDVKLEKLKVQLLKSLVSKSDFLNHETLASYIKALPIVLNKADEIDRAISTTGGIELTEIDKNWQLRKMPNQFAIGEMLDWNAPTGGYLLQACFSMGYHLANHLNKKH